MISIEELLAKLKAAKTEPPPPPVDKETALADLRVAAGEFYEKNKEMLIRPKSGTVLDAVQEQITDLQLALCEVYEMMEGM